MPNFDRKVDPSTGDYVATEPGGWERTTDSSTALLHQIKGDLGAWAGDWDAGSRLYTLARVKSTLVTDVVVLDLLRQALRPLVEAGRISEPEIRTERVRDRMHTDIVTTDLGTGRRLSLTDLLPFNV